MGDTGALCEATTTAGDVRRTSAPERLIYRWGDMGVEQSPARAECACMAADAFLERVQPPGERSHLAQPE